MSVLKKIGQVLLTGGAIASQVMGFPFVANLLGASRAGGMVELGLSDLSKVAQIVTVVETSFGSIAAADKTGSAKLAAASPMVQQLIQSWVNSNLPGHNKLKVDEPIFAGHVKDFTSAFVNILNDFGE